MTLDYVPIIDLSDFRTGDAGKRREVVDEFARACTDIGFLVIKGHGVDPTLCGDAEKAADAFFSLPLEEKLKVSQWSDDVPRGFSRIEAESLAYLSGKETPGDLKESFTMGPPEIPEDDPYYDAAGSLQLFARNIWPPTPPEFREAMVKYYRAMEHLSDDVMRVFALALGLDETYFQPVVDRHTSAFRVIHYPEQKAAPMPGQLRAGEHTDYDSFTLLWRGGYAAGLQVLNKAGEWIDVPEVKNAYVVNIGDCLMQWTNDQWVSTRHRVVNPPEDAASTKRISLVYFQQPNYDAVIKCLPTCQSADRPVKYPPVSFGEYLHRRFTSQTRFEVTGEAGY